jgi:hypothetical protein
MQLFIGISALVVFCKLWVELRWPGWIAGVGVLALFFGGDSLFFLMYCIAAIAGLFRERSLPWSLVAICLPVVGFFLNVLFGWGLLKTEKNDGDHKDGDR